MSVSFCCCLFMIFTLNRSLHTLYIVVVGIKKDFLFPYRVLSFFFRVWVCVATAKGCIHGLLVGCSVGWLFWSCWLWCLFFFLALKVVFLAWYRKSIHIVKYRKVFPLYFKEKEKEKKWKNLFVVKAITTTTTTISIIKLV